MKIGLRAGHSDNCGGAVGLVDEHSQMKTFYSYCKKVFEKYGHTVIDCNSNQRTQNSELAEGASKGNSANVDLFISLHMNASNGSGNGTEALTAGSGSRANKYATNLCSNFSGLGFKNRGVKYTPTFYEMRNVNAPNIIFEICFCDSKVDIDIYNRYSWDKLAYSLCNAIDSSIPKSPTEDPKPEPKPEPKPNPKPETSNAKGYVVTNYLPNGISGNGAFEGIDLQYVLSYFNGIRCYARGNGSGVWIETQIMPMEDCLKLKKVLGSWFHSIVAQ